MPTFYVIPERGQRNVGWTETPQVHIVHPTQHINIEAPITQTPEQAEELARRKAEQGRKAWEYIHTTDDEPKVAIAKFESMIPTYGCGCMKDYLAIKQKYPFDTSSSDAFFVSGVVIHNAVNEKLNAEGDKSKKVIPLELARIIWNRPAVSLKPERLSQHGE